MHKIDLIEVGGKHHNYSLMQMKQIVYTLDTLH